MVRWASEVERKRLNDEQQSYIKVMSCPKLEQNILWIGRVGRLLDAGGATFDPTGAASIRAAMTQMQTVEHAEGQDAGRADLRIVRITKNVHRSISEVLSAEC